MCGANFFNPLMSMLMSGIWSRQNPATSAYGTAVVTVAAGGVGGLIAVRCKAIGVGVCCGVRCQRHRRKQGHQHGQHQHQRNGFADFSGHYISSFFLCSAWFSSSAHPGGRPGCAGCEKRAGFFADCILKEQIWAVHILGITGHIWGTRRFVRCWQGGNIEIWFNWIEIF